MEKKLFTDFVGIDIAAKSFSACLFVDGKSIAVRDDFSNEEPGFLSFIDWLLELNCDIQNALFCIEGTGSYSLNLATFIDAHNLSVWIEDAKKILRAINRPKGKSDKLDAGYIAEYAYRFKDKFVQWKPCSPLADGVQALLTIRNTLVQNRKSLLQNLHSFEVRPNRFHELESQVKVEITDLTAKIREIEKQIKTAMQSNEELAQKVANLKTIRGVSTITIAELFVYTNSFGKTPDPKKMLSHLGIAPMPYESGTSVRKRAMSRGYGNQSLRDALYMAVCTNTKHGELGAYYSRLKAKGKKGLVIMNNMKAKLVRIICAIIRDNRPYLPEYISVEPRLRNS